TYALTYDDRWSIDFDSLERAFDSSVMAPRAVVLVNPNNPTGSALRRSELERLRDLSVRGGAALIADEVFFDFLDPQVVERGARSNDPIVSSLSYGDAAHGGAPAPGSGALTFALGGLSKSCGMPQMKLGWIVVDGPDDVVSEALERLDLIADTYLSVGTPVMRAAARPSEIGAATRTALTRTRDDHRAALQTR